MMHAYLVPGIGVRIAQARRERKKFMLVQDEKCPSPLGCCMGPCTAPGTHWAPVRRTGRTPLSVGLELQSITMNMSVYLFHCMSVSARINSKIP